MAFRKVQGEFVVECDACGAEHYGGCIDVWDEWMEDLRKHHWKTRKEGDQWCHYCADCAEDN
jgi:hypothetical protein